MTFTTVYESPNGGRLAIGDDVFGLAELTHLDDVAGQGAAIMWEICQKQHTNADYDPYCFDDEAGLPEWTVVAEIDGADEMHIRLYPSRMYETARLLFGMDNG